ncbi:MAG: hypothetical protein WCH31_04935 [Actinomycetes bacterium]
MKIACLLAACAAAVALLAVGADASIPGVPSIYVAYNIDCTYALTVDGIGAISAAASPTVTLPPGTYDLEITMMNPSNGYTGCARPIFKLSGPGVSVLTPFPYETLFQEQQITLQPSATYSADDENAPAATQKVFSTAASGSASALLTSRPSTASGASLGTDLVGSSALAYRGLLVASVDKGGAVFLASRGEVVAALRAGRYDIRVADASAHAGLLLQRRGRSAVVVTTAAFVGRRTRRVALAAGRWSLLARVGGKKISLTVT